MKILATRDVQQYKQCNCFFVISNKILTNNQVYGELRCLLTFFSIHQGKEYREKLKLAGETQLYIVDGGQMAALLEKLPNSL